MSTRLTPRFALLLAVACLVPVPAFAYIGPGAGFALISSFVTLAVAFVAAFFAIFTFPVRAAIRGWKRRRSLKKARARKVIVLGLDGLDPGICDELMARGELPNLRKLRDEGSYRRLGTSMPALSPVAWSTFATSTDCSGHGIYDFIARDPRSYAPHLSSSEVYGATRIIRLGPIRIPLSRGGVRGLRKSRTFWSVLTEHGVFSSVLRVPITFPVEKIDGVMVAGMCVPDLRGTQGSFTLVTSTTPAHEIGGEVVPVPVTGGTARIPGPPSPIDGKPLTTDVAIRRSRARDGNGESFELAIGTTVLPLQVGRYTPWVRLPFRAARGITMHGIARFLPTSLNGTISVYMTPIHIDPERPAMPISHPSVFSVYLSKLQGPFATLGLAEDTTALNDDVIDEQGFLDQAYGIHDERRTMWLHTLDRLRNGLAVCVFDVSDRLQHMFFRYLDPAHPANAGREAETNNDALYDMYRRMDVLVGETAAYVDKDTAFFVISDHGFTTFQRGVNLNAWLEREGLLVRKEGAGPGEYLSAIDWSKTRAYALGLGGLYINRKGRERQGIVEAAEATDIKRRICAGLLALEDDGTRAIRRMIDVERDMTGPYRHTGPDLLPGYEKGYRVSWDCAKGAVRPELFEDNVKRWSGDHCMDSEVVPGVMFTNVPLTDEPSQLIDMGPTILDLFGVAVPGYMAGRSMMKR
ncbi:MAG TPA: alkaline phosphatase family protein [Candidatus Krumholzibacteria bacterium]|nr:alkaline phosphatase family protein [Candidatus Krumholzibacteria bacterium]